MLVQTSAIVSSQSGDANHWLQALHRQIGVNDLLESQRGKTVFLYVCMNPTGNNEKDKEEPL